MNYDELIAIVEDEIIDLDESWDANKPLLIERAQLRIQRALDLNADRVEDTFTADGPEVYLPDDLIILRHIRVADGEYLLQKDLSFLRTYQPDTSVTGTPKYYAYVDDSNILISPAADAVDLELAYTVRIPILSPSQTENWLSQYMPDLLQYSLLLEMAIWTKDAEMITLYRGLFGDTLNVVAVEYNLRKRTDEYRRGEPKAGGRG